VRSFTYSASAPFPGNSAGLLGAASEAIFPVVTGISSELASSGAFAVARGCGCCAGARKITAVTADNAADAAAARAGTAGATAAATPDDTITPDEFFRADIRVGVIVRAEGFPQARNPAYKLWIDFGELGTRTSSAQLTAFYQPADLAGRLVLAVVNFPPRRVAGFPSQVLVLGVPAPDAKRVALVAPDRAVPPGTRVF